ncbi:hypothetical protein MWH25_03400 [Natroniella acetigena]|uniref:hypothetical protein n=1 Tax=Natroniella acetigena TaxID=52004 RepID=UPI00200B3944|nr:hypothetical protein [Natroniella acetigena]MCK8826791.1 hypothetical protein [Natroniella acetigena]
MKIIEERKIGEKLTVGVHKEHGEIGIFIASEDVSASCAFRPEEWENFVEVINEADQLLKKNESE